jgi:glucosamine-6-phosphate deaminase
MEVIIQSDAASMTRHAAERIARLLTEKPDAVLGLATGKTPLALYRALIDMKLDWRRVTTFNLDEYVGLAADHPGSFHAFMHENLFRHINIRPRNIHIPDGLARDIPATCRQFEEQIRSVGGIDLQILGIGREGHIGFNEPSSSLASRTRIKTLTQRTQRDNARAFGGEQLVPQHAITMGIGTIMDARQCLLLAFGRSKARAVAAMVEGPVTAMVPASMLQMHRSVTVGLDKRAASRLKRAAYYRWVYAHKPDWQR